MLEKTDGRMGAARAGYGIAAALITAFAITIPAMFILAAVLTFTDFPEKYTTYAVLLATLSGLFAAGYKAGLYNEKEGIIKGGLTGLIYMLILYLLSSIIYKDFMLSQRSIVMIVTGVLAGIIGSMLGAGRKRKPFSRSGFKSKFPDPLKKYKK
ncbi:MAG: TIGR04086 family membrane protein [Clostridiaceae bacterium]|jgi:putative membrane protein (TIGR04086 family)|nr:TIGR04086 family membrane protein [Clostridiaceae bacterium]